MSSRLSMSDVKLHGLAVLSSVVVGVALCVQCLPMAVIAQAAPAAQYTVVYDYTTNGGVPESGAPDSTIAESGSLVSLPTATKPGWSFEGWSTDKDAHSGWIGYVPVSQIIPASVTDQLDHATPGSTAMFQDLSNWNVEDGIWSVADSKLIRNYSLGTSGWRFAQLKDRQVIDGTVSMTVTMRQQAPGAIAYAGLGVRQSVDAGGWASGYVIAVGWNCTNRPVVEIHKRGPGWNKLAEFYLDGVKMGDQITIAVEMMGSRIDVYANGGFVYGFDSTSSGS
ncbi:MAG: InlB B-repeat-containing protein, partial [Propionibacteriaceae bacterium]|nr:InlB B-repeat-containing protein [Propionibacteriaceae bacterium]